MAKKKLGDADDTEDPEVSMQANIDDLTSKLEAANAEVSSLKERSETYKRLAEENETELSNIKTAMDEQKTEREREIEDLKKRWESSKQQDATKQEVIEDLTKDLAGQREEREQLEASLQAEILALKTEIKNNEKDVEAAKVSVISLKLDVEALRNEATLAQNNYERELGLHSQARSSLREARENADEEARLRRAAEELLESAKRELGQERGIWEQEKVTMQQSQTYLEKRLEEAREQSSAVHKQLETLGAMVEKAQTPGAAAAGGNESADLTENTDLRRIVAEHREVVQFLRSENELIQSQLDTAKRIAERDRAAASVMKRSLDEARAELKIVQSEQSATEGADTTDLASKLRSSEEQVKLLSDSNKLLRTEVNQLQSKSSSLQKELDQMKTSSQPAEIIKQDLSVKIASLESEKESLKRDLDSWKDRVKSLVSKFNQIDPEEHKQLQRKIERMEAEKQSLNAWKKATEEENTRIRNIAKNLNLKSREQKSQIEEQQRSINKLTEEKTKLASASSEVEAATKELDQLKATIAKMERDSASAKTELQGANTRNDRLRERLRQFQTTIRELKAENTQHKAELARKVEKRPSEGEDKPEGKEGSSSLPALPDGGFRFGPSPVSKSSQEVAPARAKEPKKGTTLRGDAPVFNPRKLTTQMVVEDRAQSSVVAAKAEPAKDSADTLSLKRKAPPQSGSEKASGGTSGAVLQRRMSGETKEMSLKEKLMEKRKKLAEALKRKAAEAKKAADEPAQKRAKTDSNADSTSSSKKVEAGSAAAEKPTEPSHGPASSSTSSSRKDETGSTAAEKPTEPSEGPASSSTKETEKQRELGTRAGVGNEKVETTKKLSGTAVQPKTELKNEAGQVTDKQEPIDNAEEKADTGASSTSLLSDNTASKPSTFGQSSSLAGSGLTGFGAVARASEMSSLPSGFGAVSYARQTKPSGFGALSTQAPPISGGFGAVSTGSIDATSKAAPSTGSDADLPLAPTAGGSGASLQSSAQAASSGFATGEAPAGFGSAFLNMRPPGSSTSPPTFSFGSSSSIKLPTPAQSAPAAPSPFGAFSAGGTFGSAFGENKGTPLSSHTLFGSAPPKEADAPGVSPKGEEEKMEDD